MDKDPLRIEWYCCLFVARNTLSVWHQAATLAWSECSETGPARGHQTWLSRFEVRSVIVGDQLLTSLPWVPTHSTEWIECVRPTWQSLHSRVPCLPRKKKEKQKCNVKRLTGDWRDGPVAWLPLVLAEDSVQFQVPTKGLTPVCDYTSKGSRALFWPPGASIGRWCPET